jgi:hypothetical protein
LSVRGVTPSRAAASRTVRDLGGGAGELMGRFYSNVYVHVQVWTGTAMSPGVQAVAEWL